MIYEQLYASGLGVFPCRQNKTPAIPRGTDWKVVATHPTHTHSWTDGPVGVPVPAGVAIIDLDLYKGITREAVEALLGCTLAWDDALIQRTQNGGEHYAFNMTWPVRQGSNLHGLQGLDTRVGEKGYICTGNGYTSHGFGVFRLTAPAALPSLPDASRSLLEHVETITPQPTDPTPTDDETVRDALRHIAPDCSRSDWVKVGMALRAHTEDIGLFAEWSSGALGGHEPPHNYVPEHVEWQWSTFKPEGGTGLGSLFYEAVQGGWRPPTRSQGFAAAFGGSDPALFDQVVDEILSLGADPKQTDYLLSEIRKAGGHKILLALLSKELKEAGLLTKPIRQQLDALAGDISQPRAQGQYDKGHAENATLYLERFYPSGGLTRSDETWYEYDGKAWVERDEAAVLHSLTMDMLGSLPQHSTITSTLGILRSLCHKSGAAINDIGPNLILFQNGVLDLSSGYLLPHSPEYFTTNILPYDYEPNAQAPAWLAFLNDTLEGDQERIALLQEWFGYMLSNSYQHHKILFMVGPERSGKGTIGRLMGCIVGAYNFSGCSLDQFTSDPFLDSLRTKSVAFSGDTAKNVSRNHVDRVIEHLKKISGGDEISFSRKYKSNVSQILPTRIVLAGNNIPRLFDDSGALAGRMMVLPFNLSFRGREDRTIEARCIAELSGIAAWALEGLRRLSLAGQFTHPDASKVEEEFIAETYSPLRVFVKDVVTFTGDPDHKVPAGDLYNTYSAWALAEREPVLARRTFIGAFKDVTRGRGCRYGVFNIEGIRSARGFAGMTLAAVGPATEGAFKPEVVG